jgi:hypothetical protein
MEHEHATRLGKVNKPLELRPVFGGAESIVDRRSGNFWARLETSQTQQSDNTTTVADKDPK